MAGSHLHRRIISAFSISMSALSAVCVDAFARMVSKFEPAVIAKVEQICAIGRSMKTVFIAKAIGSGSGESTACHGFVSLRRSLDASRLA